MENESLWSGDRLRELRGNASMSQKDLADLLGVARETVARWETGDREPNFSTLIRLTEALGVDLTDLRREQPGKSAKPPIRTRLFDVLNTRLRQLEASFEQRQQEIRALSESLLRLAGAVADEDVEKSIQPWLKFLQAGFKTFPVEQPDKE